MRKGGTTNNNLQQQFNKSTNNMTTLPSYLSETQFAEALTQALQVPVQIVNLHIKPVAICGNYCSQIYRVAVRYTTEPTTEVQELKILVKDLRESVSGISNEYFMYANVLPEITQTLQTVGIAPISPKVYWSMKTKHEVHFFEDLSAKGYVVRSRLLGYGENEAKFLLKRLGEFHAASLIYTEKHPQVVANLREFYCRSDPNLMAMVEEMISDNMNYALPIIESWPGFAEIAAKVRKNLGADFAKKFLPLFDVAAAKFAIVQHGDVWISNLLMLGDTEQPKDAVFLDYQNSFLGSPAFDIHNLLMTSVQWQVYAKRQELIATYYAAFSGTLKLCNYPAARIPSLECILEELQRTQYYTYYVLTFPFPQTMLSEELVQDMNVDAFGDKERVRRNRENIFSNQRLLETFKVMLPYLNELGVLD